MFIGKNDDDDDLGNADCSLMGGQSLTSSRGGGDNLVPIFFNNYEQMQRPCLQSAPKMVPAVTTKCNLRLLTGLYEITVFTGLRSTE
jgi:hypothetical protein